jgi:outer membrane cobalamin receptor
MVDLFRSTLRDRRGRWAACLPLVMAGLTGSLANESGEEPESAFYETATVRARPITRATAAVTIMDRETIEALDVASVAELLRFVPGVDIESTGPRAGFATAHIRGGDPNHTDVLVDGVPLNDITDQVGGAVNLNSLSAAHVERIEIVRGPLSSSFGSTGLGGAINIITKRGQSEPPLAAFGLAAGDDSVVLGSAELSQGGESRDYFVGVTWEREKDSIDVAGAQDAFEQWALQANTRVELGGRSELRLTGRYSMWDADDYPEASGGPLLGSGDLRTSDHEELSLGIEARIGNPERHHKIRATAYRHDLDRESPFIFNPSNPPASVPASVEDTTFTTWQIGWTAPQATVGKGQLNYGVDAEIEDGESDGMFLGVPPALSDISYNIDRASGGAYVEYVTERGDLLFELGARVDLPEDFDTELSPRAGLAYRFSGDRSRVRVSVGRAFKLPSFFALAVPNFGNFNLEPETVLGADAGVEHTFGATDLTVALTLFYSRFEDLVDFSDAAFGFVNVPEVEMQGAELSVDWRPVERVFVHANATRESFDNQPDALTHRPEWVGAAQFVWRVGERTRWNLDGQWVSEVYDFQVPLNGTFLTAGYQLYGTSLNIELTRRWELHARVDNLADKEYQPYIGFPGPDRSFHAGLRYRSRE